MIASIDGFRKVDNIFQVKEIRRNNSVLLYQKECKLKKPEEFYNNMHIHNFNIQKYNDNKNFSTEKTNNKKNNNNNKIIHKEKIINEINTKINNNTTKNTHKYFNAFKNKSKNSSTGKLYKKSKSENKILLKKSKSTKSRVKITKKKVGNPKNNLTNVKPNKENFNLNDNTIIKKSKSNNDFLRNFVKEKNNELMESIQKSIKEKAQKNFIQKTRKKIELLESGGLDIRSILNGISHVEYYSNIHTHNNTEEQCNANIRKNRLRPFLLNINNTSKKEKNLITSYSITNLNNIVKNKDKISRKPKINSLEYMQKIKKSIPSKKILQINNDINSNNLNEKNLTPIKIDPNCDLVTDENLKKKENINEYIKLKKQQEKESEIRNKLQIKNINFKKFNNLYKLQQNIKDIRKKSNIEFIENNNETNPIFENTNKSSTINEQEYFESCLEAIKIFNNEKIKTIIDNNNTLNKKYVKNNSYNNYNIKNNSKLNYRYHYINDFNKVEETLKRSNELFNKENLDKILLKQKQSENTLLDEKNNIQKYFFKFAKIIKKILFKNIKNNILKFIKNKNYYYFLIQKFINGIRLYALKNIIRNLIVKRNTITLIKATNALCTIIFFHNIKYYNMTKEYFRKNLTDIIICIKKIPYSFFIDKLKKFSINKKILNEENLNKVSELFDEKLNNQNESDLFLIKKLTNNRKINDSINQKNESQNNSSSIHFNLSESDLNNLNKCSVSSIPSSKKEKEEKSYSIESDNITTKNNKEISNIISNTNENIKNNTNNISNSKSENELYFNHIFNKNKEILKNFRYDLEDNFADDVSINYNNNQNDILNVIENDIKEPKSNEIKCDIIKDENNKENIILEKITDLPKTKKEKFYNEIVEELLLEILNDDLLEKNVIIDKKQSFDKSFCKKNEPLNNSNNNNSNNSNSFDNSLNNSIFKRNVCEITEKIKINNYYDNIVPLLFEKIENYLINNYLNIISDLKNSLEINEDLLLNIIEELLINFNPNYLNSNNSNNDISLSKIPIPYYNNKITQKKLIDSKLLAEFNNDNDICTLINENLEIPIEYYHYINKCIFDSANEIVSAKRKYGNYGKPLSWSIKERVIYYDYDKSEYSKKKFVSEIMAKLKELLQIKTGLIPENYTYLNIEQLICNRERKIVNIIKNELVENDQEENNKLDVRITLEKCIVSKVIMDFLLNEVIYILNHIQFSRQNPEKYHFKSIYSSVNEGMFSLGQEDNDEDDNDMNLADIS